ncbi:MAG: macro domain-containing protein [Myxococcales bacterium]
MLEPIIVQGDLLDQDVDVIVNAWNRNVIPWWLLLPQGVSGAIKRRGGYAPFREVARHGPIPLGEAVLTDAGRLPFKGIIHVAGINLLWFATERSVRGSVRSAMRIVDEQGFASVAFPVIGSGSGNRSVRWALRLMLDELGLLDSPARVRVVEYAPTAPGPRPR